MKWNGLVAVLAGLLFAACGGGDSDAEPQPLGRFSLLSAGGPGGLQGGYGGNGGSLSVIKEGGTGDLTITRSGAADADFTPSSLAVSLGSNPLIITADTFIAVVTTVPPAGTPYLLANNESLYISDGEKLTGGRPLTAT